jgi:hypothetical protein
LQNYGTIDVTQAGEIGTFYIWGCTPRLVSMVGASKAMEIVMTCGPIDGGDWGKRFMAFMREESAADIYTRHGLVHRRDTQ